MDSGGVLCRVLVLKTFTFHELSNFSIPEIKSVRSCCTELVEYDTFFREKVFRVSYRFKRLDVHFPGNKKDWDITGGEEKDKIE